MSRGLSTERKYLWVIDGSKALKAAIGRRTRAAYKMADYEDARRSLELTIGHLERLNPSAA